MPEAFSTPMVYLEEFAIEAEVSGLLEKPLQPVQMARSAPKKTKSIAVCLDIYDKCKKIK